MTASAGGIKAHRSGNSQCGDPSNLVIGVSLFRLYMALLPRKELP